MHIFEVVTFFSRLVVIQSTQFFSGSTCLLDSCFWWSIFPLNHKNAYGHQIFQVGDMLRGAVTHKYTWYLNGVVLWGHVTNKIHASTCRRCINTTLGKVLTRWESPKHDPLIKRPTWGHATVWKIYITTCTRFVDKKLSRLLTFGTIFSTQKLRSSQKFSFSFSIFQEKWISKFLIHVES